MLFHMENLPNGYVYYGYLHLFWTNIFQNSHFWLLIEKQITFINEN